MTNAAKTEPSEIDRIAGRMVHRAAASMDFLEGIADRKRLLERRTGDQDSGRELKLEDLEERADRLARAVNDYRKAEKIIRAFPALLAAAQDYEARGSYEDIPMMRPARQAIRNAEDALK